MDLFGDAESAAVDGLIDLMGFRIQDGKPTATPNVADSSSRGSVAIARHVMEAMGVSGPSSVSGNPGPRFERLMREHLARTLPDLRPDLDLVVDQRKLADFEQYAHLDRLQKLIKEDKSRLLAAEFGSDYLVKPDATVHIPGVSGGRHLHASVSCKWTLRSDRAQNVRHEAVMMVRHRRGRLPHMVAVTMEPMPSRIAALAKGTGEVDSVYHPLLRELIAAVRAVGGSQQNDALDELLSQDRLLPLSDLPRRLAFT